MSEYTPTTAEIREDYKLFAGGESDRETARAEFDRWLAAHDAEVRAGVVAEEPEGRRWFSAAYRAQNGNIIPIGDETVLAEYAEKTVDEFAREDDEGPEYFLASRILPPWVPVKQEGTECKHSDFFSLNLGSGRTRHTCRDCGETTDFDS